MQDYQAPVRVLFSIGNAVSPDCDCACTPALQPTPSWTAVSTMLFQRTPAKPVLQQGDWEVYHNPLGPAAVVAFNPAAQILWQRFATPAMLQSTDTNPQTQTALLALLQSGMVHPVASAAPLMATTQVLGAWIHIAERCNLNCDYCYLSKRAPDPTSETLRGMIDAALRSATANGHTTVHLKYSGGEPLLRFPVMMETHHYAQVQASHLGINVDGVVLSNGTLLTPTMVAQLRAANLRLMLSLDGLGEVHDSQRHYPDGRGSFVDVARAIDLAQQGGLEPLISVTITGRNAPHLPELVSWLLERNLPFSLNLYRENDCSVADPGLRLAEERIIVGMLGAYKVIEKNLPRRSLLGALTDRASFVAPHCRTCSVGQDYLVFDSQGRVSKCQMDMAHPVTDINDPDPLRTIRASATGLQNLSVDDKDECRECEWRYWCGGGCPLMTHRATGSYTAKSPYCNIYKAIFPEALRLEGLRLIKYADVLVGFHSF